MRVKLIHACIGAVGNPSLVPLFSIPLFYVLLNCRIINFISKHDSIVDSFFLIVIAALVSVSLHRYCGTRIYLLCVCVGDIHTYTPNNGNIIYLRFVRQVGNISPHKCAAAVLSSLSCSAGAVFSRSQPCAACIHFFFSLHISNLMIH